jgi:AcrR family transcriptional regulator
MGSTAPTAKNPSRTGKDRRSHVSGEVTRSLLIDTAERLFAERGIDGVSPSDIKAEAGQRNSSVVAYHFGSMEGLVRAIVEVRHPELDADHERLLRQMESDETLEDVRSVVWLVVRPLANSVERSPNYLPFLARLSEQRYARYWTSPETEYQPRYGEAMVHGLLEDLPERARRVRAFQFYNSVLHVLAEQARTRRRLGEALLCNLVDGWVAMLSAPISEETLEELDAESR